PGSWHPPAGEARKPPPAAGRAWFFLHPGGLGKSALATLGVRVEQLLTLNLEFGDRLLALRTGNPVDEGLAGLGLDVRVHLRIDQNHAVLVEELLVAL